MGKEIVLFKSEERSDPGRVASFLRELADKVAAGQVTLKQGAQDLTLYLPAALTLEVKAEEEAKSGGTQRSLEVEIEWTEGDDHGGGVALG